MVGMPLDIATEREKNRRPSGQFGRHAHSAPEQTLNTPRPLFVSVPSAVLHDVQERGLFGRTRTKTHTIPVELRVATIDRAHTEDGERGERLINGQAYLPALRDGQHAPADQDALVALAQGTTARLPKLEGSAEQAAWQADNHLHRHPQPGYIIDGMLWVRASHAADTRY